MNFSCLGRVEVGGSCAFFAWVVRMSFALDGVGVCFMCMPLRILAHGLTMGVCDLCVLLDMLANKGETKFGRCG